MLLITYDTFYINLDCKICNFVDDTTPSSCRQSIDAVTTEVDNTFTSRFDAYAMVANPATFQMMLLAKKVDTDFYLNVNGKIIPENEQVKFLGIAINSSAQGWDFSLDAISNK